MRRTDWPLLGVVILLALMIAAVVAGALLAAGVLR